MTQPHGPAEVVARAAGPLGEVVLRTVPGAGAQARDLVVGGVFVMDTEDASTERLLATAALNVLGRTGTSGWHVVVAGLGLGFTLAAVLEHSEVSAATVVELEPAIVEWVGADLVPATAGVLRGPRVRVVVGDVQEAVGRLTAVDALLLDVDNGPGFLVHQRNAGLYRPPFLRSALATLRPGGVLAIWSADPAPELERGLRALGAAVDVQTMVVTRGTRALDYWVYLAVRQDRPMADTLGEHEYRIEHDTMGEVRVPADAKWRAQTQRAVENFPISGSGLPAANIRALARIKAAAAVVNQRLGVLDADVAAAIGTSALEVAEGRWDAEFPIDVFQTGSGTSSNMNVNEVVATLASQRLGRPVHPNDDVNASQSSNDTYPTSIHVAATAGVLNDLVPALEALRDALRRKADEFADVVKAGRTHLMDATPVTLGQEFGGYAAQLDRGLERLQASVPRVAELPLGGTAVGTGINTPPGFAANVITELREQTGLPLTEARDHFEAQGSRDALVELSGQLRTIAVSLFKVCTDLRWMGSGPRAGLGEIRLPDLQPGSSIMPGKVNPVVPEAVSMVCAQVIGNDAAIAFAGAVGNFELNVMMPVMARNLLESIRLLAAASRQLAGRCVDGIEADVERCRELAESSPSIVTPLNRFLGYEAAAKVAKAALAQRKTIRQVVVEQGFVERGAITEQELDDALDVLRMTRPPR